ncbi:MAG: TIGR03960 family B12-binding radical SAM protein [Candidatus Omnitrophica bacterium]|nr:TIGR03960 family B12-binding radical SAM protein [Candidatus Omnitrophota bacterium]
MTVEDILTQVERPGRYIGEEWNCPKKDFSRATIRFALCFADLYEVGMSNIGLRILYGLLNDIADVACERFFSCNPDMEEALRRNKKDIFSLESKEPLGAFDIIGFSLGYELSYTNVLNILDLGRIPLESSLRGPSHPLVIGGGPCVLNPEPIADFFDLFVIGEAEEAIIEIVDLYRRLKEKFKSGKISKKELLAEFCGIEGVYAPLLYDPAYDSSGRLEDFRPRSQGLPRKIKKRFIKGLDSSYFPIDWLVPYSQIVHDRVALEIMRGCPNRCAFCQARVQYYPFRKKEIDTIVRAASQSYKLTGYEEMSLAGLSVSDYPEVERLVENLVGLFRDRGVCVSLPSIKPKALVGNLSYLVSKIKKTGLTFAPEAATERLRKCLNKEFDSEEFLRTLEQAYASGYQRVKLYFMIGLPTESLADVDAIIEMASSISKLKARVSGSPAQVNISVNTLIPKPHTAFERFRMEGEDSIIEKQDHLRQKAKRIKRLKLSVQNIKMSTLEGILSRGDRRLSKVILSAFRKGAKFDAWDDHFVFEKWQEAFLESGVDPAFYLKERPQEELLPWEFLDMGVNK